MTVQKFVTYTVLDTDGQVLSEEQKLELSVVEVSGNYLHIKIFHGTKVIDVNGLFQQKLEVK